MPWLARGRHIGGLCDVLVEAGVDQDWSADDVLSHLDAENMRDGRLSLSPAAQRNPFGLLLTQLRRVVSEVEAPGARRRREAREREERARARAEQRERERQDVATPEQVAAHMARIRASLEAGRRRSLYEATS